MTHNLSRPVCMIQARQRLQEIAMPTSPHIPLVQRLAKALAKDLPPQISPYEFVTRATLASDRVYKGFEKGPGRSKLLAQHITVLAQEACTSDFAATVKSMYAPSGDSL